MVDAADIALPTRGARVSDVTLVPAAGSGAAAVAECCKVQGDVACVDLTAPPIKFDVAMPTSWNGKAMQCTGGGYDGSATVRGAGGYPSPLARGYVGFGSDAGHAGSPAEASFALNQEALENYLATSCAKRAT